MSRVLVLMIDDNEDDVELFATVFAKASTGFEFSYTLDAADGLARLQAEGSRVRLVLLDIKMPSRDGKDVLSEIRRMPALRHLPVVVFNRSPDKAMAVAEQCGAIVAATARDAVAQAEVVVVSLADDAALQAAYAGEDGLLAGVHEGVVICDTSTVAPATIRTLAPQVAELGEAHQLLRPLLGSAIAPSLFAIALLCCGLNSTVTATLAGQAVMEGFLDIRLPPWSRRLLTRAIAIVPAAAVTILKIDPGSNASDTARLRQRELG